MYKGIALGLLLVQSRSRLYFKSEMKKPMLKIHSWFFRKVMVAGAIVFFMGWCLSTSASVIVLGTRFVYPADARELNLQFSNQDNYPSVMQIWVDVDKPNASPEDADAPFVVTPPIFRIEPNSGQTARLIFTGAGLPLDRESLFYLNTLQIPPSMEAYKGENQVMLLLRNRMKIFYRPSKIIGKSEEVHSKIHFKVRREGQDWLLTGENPTGFHASLVSGNIQAGVQKWSFTPEMLKPFSEATWKIENAGNLPDGILKIMFTLMDDYGAEVAADYEVRR